MSLTPNLRRAAVGAASLVIIALLCALYLADLTGMGMAGPDEPRYAAIGQAMAQSGDWITPRLWGAPWFEKPALLYWMTAAGFRAGLGVDLAPRLPVALLSLVFLAFFHTRIRHEWDARAANISTAMLATSAGWLTYSHVAVTDLPLAVFFTAALLFSLPWIARGDRTAVTRAAACLGLAVLAKGLVPLVLFVPVFFFPVAAGGWRRITDWFRPAPLLAFSLVTLPWYVLCTLRNGNQFLRVFFIEQQFERFSTAALQHVQPWWYYVPIALLLLYPWFPLALTAAPLLRPRELSGDLRLRALLAVALFGFVFFSASVNKLPGYLLPLLPAVCVLTGVRTARTPVTSPVLIAVAALLALLPLSPSIVAEALAHGLRASDIPWMALLFAASAGALAGFVLTRTARAASFAIIATLAAGGFLWLQFAAFPVFDFAASARPIWRASHPQCAANLSRSLTYGLYYYSGREIPKCTVLDQAAAGVVR